MSNIADRYIRVRFQFEYTHAYPDAPDEVAFLRSPHRHMFHVTATIETFDDDRELEFIMVKNALQYYVGNTKNSWPMLYSCEMMARTIATYIRRRYGNHRCIAVEVTEDGENGAIISWNSDTPMFEEDE